MPTTRSTSPPPLGSSTSFIDVQAAAEHGDERLAAGLGGDAKLGGFARLVARLVERDVEDFRALGRLIAAVPAGIEGDAGDRAVAIRRADLEAIAAVAGIGRDASRAPSAEVSTVPFETLRVSVCGS